MFVWHEVDGQRLTLLTLNLFSERADVRDLQRVIYNKRPDLVAVQELGRDAARVLEQNYEYGLLLPSSGFGGMGIACNREAEAHALETPNPRAVGAVLSGQVWGEAFDGMMMISARLPPPTSWTDLRTRRDYVGDLGEILDLHVGPLCLAGDLNSTPLWPAYRVLARNLSDGAVESASALAAVFRPTWPSVFPLFRIDHVLARGVRVPRVERLSVRGTDHRALLAVLEADDDRVTESAASG